MEVAPLLNLTHDGLENSNSTKWEMIYPQYLQILSKKILSGRLLLIIIEPSNQNVEFANTSQMSWRVRSIYRKKNIKKNNLI